MSTSLLDRELARLFNVRDLSADFVINWDARSVLLTIALANRLFGVMLRAESLRTIGTFQELYKVLREQKPLKGSARKVAAA